MSKFKKQSHAIYQCKYHIVWCPKSRYRILKGAVREQLEYTLRSLCEWKKVEIVELNIQEDHVHIIVEILPRVSVSEVMGWLKGKSAIKLVKSFSGLKKEAVLGKSFLGTRVLCEHDWLGRRKDPKVCEISGGAGKRGRSRGARIWPLLEACFKATTSGGGRLLKS